MITFVWQEGWNHSTSPTSVHIVVIQRFSLFEYCLSLKKIKKLKVGLDLCALFTDTKLKYKKGMDKKNQHKPKNTNIIQ